MAERDRLAEAMAHAAASADPGTVYLAAYRRGWAGELVETFAIKLTRLRYERPGAPRKYVVYVAAPVRRHDVVELLDGRIVGGRYSDLPAEVYDAVQAHVLATMGAPR